MVHVLEFSPLVRGPVVPSESPGCISFCSTDALKVINLRHLFSNSGCGCIQVDVNRNILCWNLLGLFDCALILSVM